MTEPVAPHAGRLVARIDRFTGRRSPATTLPFALVGFALVGGLSLVVPSSVRAADAEDLRFRDLVASPSWKDVADPAVRIYWAGEPTPAFAERTRPDVYTRSGLRFGLTGGTRVHCVEAFEKAVKAMVDDAKERGYDAIVGLQAANAKDGQPIADTTGFSCTPGFRTTEVSLIGSFAMTPDAAKRYQASEAATAQVADRPPAKNAVFVPLAPVLASPEARAITGPGISVAVGLDGPPYRDRYGPDTWSEDVPVGKLERDAACRQAILKTLEKMVGDAKERRYDAIIRVRSYLDDRYAPVATDAECVVDGKSATVKLRASLATRK